jgi:site-specific recombinase XerD
MAIRPADESVGVGTQNHRHLRGPRVLCHNNGRSLTGQYGQSRVLSAARRARVRKGVHILRHSFCSRLAMKGAETKSIQELAGHQDLAVTQRYMHLTVTKRDAAIRLLDSNPSSWGDSGESVLGWDQEAGVS